MQPAALQRGGTVGRVSAGGGQGVGVIAGGSAQRDERERPGDPPPAAKLSRGGLVAAASDGLNLPGSAAAAGAAAAAAAGAARTSSSAKGPAPYGNPSSKMSQVRLALFTYSRKLHTWAAFGMIA
jgi:hypothetical protein